MQPSQYSLRHRSLVDATIYEQRILGLRDLHLQWWQNVHVDVDDDVVVVVRLRFLDGHRGEEAQARILRGHASRLRYFRDRRRHPSPDSQSQLRPERAWSASSSGLWYLKKRRRFLES